MKKTIWVIALVLAGAGAQAQQRTIYGPDGRVVGREATDSSGATVLYDSQGRPTVRSVTDSAGTTQIYDRDGRKVGTSTPGRN